MDNGALHDKTFPSLDRLSSAGTFLLHSGLARSTHMTQSKRSGPSLQRGQYMRQGKAFVYRQKTESIGIDLSSLCVLKMKQVMAADKVTISLYSSLVLRGVYGRLVQCCALFTGIAGVKRN